MKRILVLLTLVLCGFNLSAQQKPAYPKKYYNLEKEVAIQGYDPVSYFKLNKAERGKENISFNYNGVIYKFSSEENKKLFVENPSKYEPQYGGFCAYAMAEGEMVRIDPETFKIVDDKLYLFYNFRFTNTLKLWNKEEGILLPKADKEWAKIIKN